MIVTGVLRRPEHFNPFVPKNDPAHGQWFRLTPDDIAAAKDLKDVLPYILYADNDHSGDSRKYPLATATKWLPPNNHRSYAIFWFTMAGVLLVIYYLRFFRP